MSSLVSLNIKITINSDASSLSLLPVYRELFLYSSRVSSSDEINAVNGKVIPRKGKMAPIPKDK